jgi:Domain of unknown function (DUF4382)
MKTPAILFVLLLTVAATLAINGCLSTTDTEETATGQGQVILNLIDAPGDYEEVNISFVRVDAHIAYGDSASEWMTLNADSLTYNLLDYTNGQSVVVANTMLPEGHYTQIRLMIGDGSNVVVDGVAHPLTIPSGEQSGLKLTHGFDLVDGAVYEATLDFDADKSVHVTGNGRYTLKPTVRIVVNALSGSLRGVVQPVEARAKIMAIAALDTFTTFADTLTGHFKFPVLPAATYDLNITATAGAYNDTILTDVLVESGIETNLGGIVLED